MFRKTDLTLQSYGNNKLLILDNDSNPVTTDAEYNLTRRRSTLFTVEGYFVYQDDRANFFETNTKENFTVSKLGAFYDACRQYHQLTEKKSEPIYLKAVGFLISDPNADGDETESLVLKRIVQTSSVSPQQ